MEFPRPEVVRFYIETLAGEIGGSEMSAEIYEYESSYARWDVRFPTHLWTDGPEGKEVKIRLLQGEMVLLLSLEREGRYDELLMEMDAIVERAYSEGRE